MRRRIPGIRGIWGGGGKKREVRSGHFLPEVLPERLHFVHSEE